MSTEQNKQNVRRLIEEAWSIGRLETVDEVCAPDYHQAGLGGIAELKQMIVAYHHGFPDEEYVIEEMIAEGDTVVSRWRWRGTHQGEFDGVAPTNKTVTDTGISIFHLVNGKIVDDCFESRHFNISQLLMEPPGEA
jgi:predicted ester cyclase